MNENVNNSLICPKCGMENDVNYRFCIKCGNSLQLNMMENENNIVDTNLNTVSDIVNDNLNQHQPVMNNLNHTVSSDNLVQSNVNMNSSLDVNNLNQQVVQPGIQSVNNNQVSLSQTTKITSGNLNYMQYIVGAVLKPFDKFKQDEEKIGNFKNAGILSLIIVGVMTIIGLIQTMINAVRVTSFWSDEVEWVWENLKEIEYVKVIGQSLLIYVGILFAISGVYFLASLVIKKEVKFPKLFGATVTAFIPFAIATSILSPLFSLIYSPLGMCVTVVGLIYTLLILLELVNELIKIENKNTRIYFQLACLSILLIAGGFVAYKLILGSLASSLGGLSSLLG